MSFQAAASQQGAMFDQQCRYLLTDAGWDVSPRPLFIPDAGVEIDCTARRNDLTVWVEFKGSWRGEQPGMRRTDTTKKAIVSGYLLRSAGYTVPYVVLTSHMPAANSAGDTMVRLAVETGAVAAVICINDQGWAKAFDQAARR